MFKSFTRAGRRDNSPPPASVTKACASPNAGPFDLRRWLVQWDGNARESDPSHLMTHAVLAGEDALNDGDHRVVFVRALRHGTRVLVGADNVREQIERPFH